MKKSILTIGLFSLIMILTSFTTPETVSATNVENNGSIELSGSGATGGTKKLDLSGSGATGGTKKLDLSGSGATGGTKKLDLSGSGATGGTKKLD